MLRDLTDRVRHDHGSHIHELPGPLVELLVDNLPLMLDHGDLAPEDFVSRVQLIPHPTDDGHFSMNHL